MRKQSTISNNTRNLVGIAVFSAMAFCVALVTNIPVGFLTFDAKDAVITVASFIYGPVAAVIMSFITAFLEMITVGNTGPYGALMDFISTASFTVTASLIYKYRRKLSGAIISLGSAAVVYVAVMMIANLFITPLYMGVSVVQVKALLPKMILPFNVAKALMNSALVMLVYKPVVNLTRRMGLAVSKSSSKKPAGKYFNKDTLVMASIAIVALVSAIVIFVVLRK